MCFTLRLHMSAAPAHGGLTQALAPMLKLRHLVLAAISLSAAFEASACRLVYPDPAKSNEHSSIFLGIVTGVHLAGLENRLLGKPDAHIDGMPVNLTGGASPVVVTVVPLSGPSKLRKAVQELRIGQCRGDVPQLRARGIFFVGANARSAMVVWESETVEFAKWSSRVEVRAHGR